MIEAKTPREKHAVAILAEKDTINKVDDDLFTVKRTFLSKAMLQVAQVGLCYGKRRTTSSNSIEKSLMNITTKDQMLNQPSEQSNRSLERR